ncbi:hypothetical protein [Lachnoclostridium sp. Marseille-P6806]|uniref:hypothetical protein n=1 Tax=Lachnoclostridium sp. Marseille-P6806 TaxID=2364793 RepID=UPI0010311AED|nr:hypothetical protein [Lachnoclostridium sp. Marseille-P6806]
MFAERFDSLMNIAEVSNSLLANAIHMNSSHIGRLRSGARPLPKKHEYLGAMCLFLARHFRKEYQINALQKLTGIGNGALLSPENTALYLEQWLLEAEQDPSLAAGRLISGFSHFSSHPVSFAAGGAAEEAPEKYASYLYGNAGKRKAVEQFFRMILQEKKPQTLLLFSDESMEWLYEDAAFAARWSELFTRVIAKGNRIRVIHTISRDMNELLEAVAKWIPIYMTGMIEPYYYPRLRDGLFQRTMFIAPHTAAVISSSVQQNAEGALNIFLTDRAAIEAVSLEYARYLQLCRPLMRFFTGQDADELRKAARTLSEAEGDACLCSAAPPLFAMPESLVRKLAEQRGNELLLPLWKQSVFSFRRSIEKQRLTLIILDPKTAPLSPAAFRPPLAEFFACPEFSCTHKQYMQHFEAMRKLEKKYDNLTVVLRNDLSPDMLLYVKEDAGVIMAKADPPISAFAISERNMVNAFWDYLKRMS